jgi:Pectate lyase superfamily protein
MAIEVYANNASTTLAATISSATATSCTVASATALPATGPYRVLVDSEIMIVTAGFGTATLTLVRGQEGTTATTHVAGATIAQKLTAGGTWNAPGWHSVRSYGAKGDGTTNDTAAIHLARDIAKAGGTVFFPDGTYIASGLSPLTGQTWILAKGATLKLPNAATTQILTPSNPDITITGGVLDGNKAGQSAPAFDAACIVAISGATRLRVLGVEVKDADGTGIRIAGADHSEISQCHIHDNGVGTQTFGGIFCDTGTDYVLIAFNRVEGNANTGIKIKGDAAAIPSLAPRIIGNRVSGGRIATGGTLYLGIEAWGLAHRAIIANNYVEIGATGDQIGISISGSDDCSVNGNVVYSPIASATNNRVGIEIVQANSTSVCGNTVDFTSPGSGGEDSCCSISNTPPCVGISITGNAFRNGKWGIKSVNPMRSVVVGQNLFRNTTAGLDIVNWTQATINGNVFDTVENAISMSSSAGNASTDIIITDNNVMSATDFCRLWPDSGTFNRITISNNRCQNTPNIINHVQSVPPGTFGPDLRYFGNQPGTNDTEGRMPWAFAQGIEQNTVTTTSQALAANGGTVMVCIDVAGYMSVQSISLRSQDATLMRSIEGRLYRELPGTGVLVEVLGSSFSTSFTATAASNRTVSVASPGAVIPPGIYWLALRNTQAANTFALGTASAGTLAGSGAQTKTLASALTSTLDAATGWTKVTWVPGVRVNGRAFAQTTAF